MNFWTETTRYGGTLQSAVDHIISLDPGKEDVQEVLPHVAAMAAAFGDPGNRYLKYIQEKKSNYAQQSFWLFDQTAAFTMAPASDGKAQRSAPDMELFPVSFKGPDNSAVKSPVGKACPPVFDGQNVIELDPGISVTCVELEPFYP